MNAPRLGAMPGLTRAGAVAAATLIFYNHKRNVMNLIAARKGRT